MNELTHISNLGRLAELAKDVDLDKFIYAQVAGENGPVFSLGLYFSVLDNGHPYFQMNHPDLGIYSIKEQGGHIPPDHVQMPKNLEHAKAMMVIAERYIQDNS